ncbi:prepilin peptidase [Actinomyces sp. W5033]|uniref:prepilin peptidase n=1 Tax=Actinomyces sp. W5033 TaxID=3446479 RepID=UPI003EE3B515
MPLALLALTLVLAACGAAVHGPVSRFARAYVEDLLDGGAHAPGTGAGMPAPVLRAAAGRRRLLLPRRLTALFLAAALPACAAALDAGCWWEAALALPVLAALTVAGSTDAVCHRLPNRLLGPAAGWAAACSGGEAVLLALGSAPGLALSALIGSVGAAAVLGGVCLLLALAPSGLGMGDVKLCALTGLWLGRLGWAVPVVGVVAGLLLAGSAALALMVLGRVRRDTPIALGPYLMAGAYIAWLLALA